MRRSVVRVAFHRPAEMLLRFSDEFRGVFPVAFQPAQQGVMGLDAGCAFMTEQLGLSWRQFDLQYSGDAARHLILQGKNILYASVEAFGPDMPARACLDQLHRDPDVRTGALYAALQQVLHAKVSGNRFRRL